MSNVSEINQQRQSIQKRLWDIDGELRPLGARKRGKTPEVVQEIQETIDALREEKSSLQSQLKQLDSDLEVTIKAQLKQEKLDKLNNLQAERDAKACIQNNAIGRKPNNKRDVGWW